MTYICIKPSICQGAFVFKFKFTCIHASIHIYSFLVHRFIDGILFAVLGNRSQVPFAVRKCWIYHPLHPTAGIKHPFRIGYAYIWIFPTTLGSCWFIQCEQLGFYQIIASCQYMDLVECWLKILISIWWMMKDLFAEIFLMQTIGNEWHKTYFVTMVFPWLMHFYPGYQ